MLDKLQKHLCRTVGPSPDASLEPLAHYHNIVSLSLFHRYYFGRCSFELVELAPLPCSRGRSTRYSISSNFLLPFLHVIRMSVSTSTISFWLELDSGILSLKSAFLWPSIYMAHNVELFGTFFIWILYISYSSFPFSFSCKSMSYNDCSALHRVNPYLKKILKNALI